MSPRNVLHALARDRQLRRQLAGRPEVVVVEERDPLAACLGDGSQLGIRLRYSWEQPVLGSAGGPRHALPLLTDGGAQRFLIVNGVAMTRIMGERRYAMRLWLDRQALAGRRLTVQDIEAALRRENLQLPAGFTATVNSTR